MLQWLAHAAWRSWPCGTAASTRKRPCCFVNCRRTRGTLLECTTDCFRGCIEGAGQSSVPGRHLLMNFMKDNSKQLHAAMEDVYLDPLLYIRFASNNYAHRP